MGGLAKMIPHIPNPNRLEEHVANLLISCNLTDQKHANRGHHLTHVYGYEPIFKCGICHELKQRGVLARTREKDNTKKVSHWSYFICHECMEKAKQGRDQP
jgi:hypothetical protein